MAQRNTDELYGKRLLLLAWALASGVHINTEYVRTRFGVSVATAKRDLALIDAVLRGRHLTKNYRKRREIALANPPASLEFIP